MLFLWRASINKLKERLPLPSTSGSQLTAADYVGDWQSDEDYQYDENGNRELVNEDTVYETDAYNRMVSDGTYRYEYDAEGNRTARFVDVDEDGQLQRRYGHHRIHLGPSQSAGNGHRAGDPRRGGDFGVRLLLRCVRPADRQGFG